MDSPYSERFDEALVFSHRLHRKQKRKTCGAPYFCHLLGVASLVIEDGGTEEEAIAALLHDSLEDQSRHYPGGYAGLAADISRRFGPGVLHLVEELTETATDEERALPDKRARWRLHKQRYIEQILSACPSVQRVSSADSLFNVRSMIKDYQRLGDKLWDRFMTRSGEDQLWAYHRIAQAFLTRASTPITRELDREVRELARVSGISPE